MACRPRPPPSAAMATFSHAHSNTPLPLNLTHKQATTSKQATSKQALLLSVLAIASPHRYGLYSTLATLEPRWWPCQIQVFSQKNQPVAPQGGCGKPGGGFSKLRILCPKIAFFMAQNCPKTHSKRTNEGKRLLPVTP